MNDHAAVPALPSATVMLLRDGPRGLEVFMVERHQNAGFASGALVFPGGKLDPEDTDPELAELSANTGLTPDQTARRMCGIRETFEEAGVLLARERPGGALVSGARMTALSERYRAPIHAGELGLKEMAARERLSPACDLLVPFAHWITPAVSARRFDTWFYLVPAPENGDEAHDAVHDGAEAVDSAWLTPAEAFAEQDAGRRTMVFVTRMNLEKLSRATTVADALAAARADSIVSIEPTVEKVPGGRRFRIPLDAGYATTEAVMKDGAP